MCAACRGIFFSYAKAAAKAELELICELKIIILHSKVHVIDTLVMFWLVTSMNVYLSLVCHLSRFPTSSFTHHIASMLYDVV